MATFVLEDIYRKAFPFDSRVKEQLRLASGPLWAQSAVLTDESADPIRIACVGYGSGWRDLPVILALRDQLAESAKRLGRSARPIHVLGIEPSWDKQSTYAGSDLQVTHSSSIFHYSATVYHGDGIHLEVVRMTVEQWIDGCRRENRSFRWDAVFALCVLHLLNDWKAALAFFLNDLAIGGSFLFGSTPGSVSAFDGQFKHDLGHRDTPWERTWRRIYEQRDKLLLPNAKIVSPRDMTFLQACLNEAGYLAAGAPINLTIPSSMTREDIEVMIRSVELGPDANTFGALRINDVERARVFVHNCVTAVHDDVFTYVTGIEIASFRKSSETRSPLTSVARTACVFATALATECKTRIKRAIPHCERPHKRGDAVTSLLYDMRECLALSRDSFIVSTTKLHGRYIAARQLPPISLIGTKAASVEMAMRFVCSHAAYLSTPTEMHLSHVFDIHMGDLSLEIVSSPSVDIQEMSHTSIEYTVDGHPAHVRVLLSEELLRNYAERIRELILLYSAEISQEMNNVYRGWSSDNGFERFYYDCDPYIIKNLFQKHSPLKECQKAIDAFTQPLLDSLKGSIARNLQATLHDDVKALSATLANALRLAMIELSHDDKPTPWRACVYILRQIADDHGNTGVGFLFLLSSSDYDAWSARYASTLRQFVWAAEPYINAIHELELLATAKSDAMHEVDRLLGHEVSPLYSSARRAIEIARLGERDVSCKYVAHIARDALLMGQLWCRSFNNSLTQNDMVFAHDNDGNGRSIREYIGALSQRAFQLFMSSCVVSANAQGLATSGQIAGFCNLYEATPQYIAMSDGCGEYVFCECNAPDRYGADMFRWFVVALVNALKHVATPNNVKVWGNQSIGERLEAARQYAKTPVTIRLDISQDKREATFSFRNCHVSEERKSPSRAKKTGFALDTAARECHVDASVFYGLNTNGEWVTALTLPGLHVR